MTSRLHSLVRLYVGLGLLEIVVVVAGAAVGRGAWQAAHQTDLEDRDWTAREGRVAHLSELALELDQPAHDVFASGSAGKERWRVQAVAQEIESQISLLRQEIDSSGVHPVLQERLQRVEAAVPALAGAAISIIDDFDAGQAAKADRMARLDRSFATLQNEIGSVTRRMLEDQEAMRVRHERSAAGVRLWSGLLAAAAVVIVIAASLFGAELTSELNEAGRRAQADLARIAAAERRFREIIEGAPDAIVVHRGGTILMVNRRMVELTGWDSPRDLLGRDVLDTVHPGSRDAARERISRMQRTGESPDEPLELELLRCDGSSLDAEVNTVVIDLDGRPAALALIRDLTQRKHAAQALLRAKDEAEAASRAKSEFLANMSHELRTPLNSVIGFGKVLQEGSYGLVGEKQRRFVTNIVRSGEHMLSLVNDLLDLRRLETGSMTFEIEPLDLAEVVEEATAIVRSQLAERGHELGIELATSARASGDRRAVVQILVNLLTNAAKYTPNGGHVFLTASEAAGKISIEVRDDGRGIPAEDLPRLFGVFSRVGDKEARRIAGSGLGLALCKGLVEKLGGEIGVRSELGRGSTFFFTVPATPLALEARTS